MPKMTLIGDKMSNFFNPDNKVFSFLGKVFDIVVLNVVWLALYIPFFGLLYLYGATGFVYVMIPAVLSLVVFVPSLTALYYSIVKAIRHQRSYPLTEFFRSFKANFRQGAIVSVFLMIFAGIISLDFVLLKGEESTYFTVLRSALMAVSYFVLGTLVFFCPVISRFNMTLKDALKFSFGLSVKHVWCTILSLLLWATDILIVYITGGAMILFAIAPAMLVESFMMEKVLKRYVLEVLGRNKEPEKKNASGDETGEDGALTDTDQNTEKKENEEDDGTIGKHEDESRDEWYVE